ncbi:adaptor complexes medium subunit family protein [Purpureocillium lilacinum]|uniref:Adaptor complexes medium subunit family protein n=1 Tax=Purpureocillium lilacinum TaxID=33203 RepID=A0A2U3EL87_PURLI|nr:adaptor complexes medium subunit family protein [Purpureocillium lilacinum]
MNGVIEAVHVYDDNRNALLSHTYTGRPLSAAHLLPLYLEHPAPRPNLIYLPNTSPPTLVFSLSHANLLLLATSSTEIEPLLVLEFLHRIVDALEDFLGAPLLAVKIENNYDIVAQLLTEMCDAGTISTTEPNALREVVEIEGWVGKLLGSITLPGKTPLGNNLSNPSAPSLVASNTPALPWRRANVRHTSNEMYADVVETLSVTLAPSGRPLAAFANGTIAFTAKVSGVPDITLSLSGPSGRHNLAGIVELPVFHPCVRLNRWKERPGELSFIPPDGRFILAGYEVDLLPFTSGKSGSLSANNLKLPVNLDMKTGLGTAGSEFEVRLQVNKIFGSSSSSSGGQLGRGSNSGRLGGPHPGTPAAPLLDDLKITIPLPDDVRNLSDIRPSRGDASFNPGERALEWHVPAKELSGPTSHFGLRCTVVGPLVDEEEQEFDPSGFGFGNEYSYSGPYQSSPSAKAKPQKDDAADEQDAKRVAQNKILMPSSASVSFSVKGWLASGLKVDSIAIDTRKSRGLGEGVKPYKGVKSLPTHGIQPKRVWRPAGPSAKERQPETLLWCCGGHHPGPAISVQRQTLRCRGRDGAAPGSAQGGLQLHPSRPRGPTCWFQLDVGAGLSMSSTDGRRCCTFDCRAGQPSARSWPLQQRKLDHHHSFSSSFTSSASLGLRLLVDSHEPRTALNSPAATQPWHGYEALWCICAAAPRRGDDYDDNDADARTTPRPGHSRRRRAAPEMHLLQDAPGEAADGHLFSR